MLLIVCAIVFIALCAGLGFVWTRTIDLREIGSGRNLDSIDGRTGFVGGFCYLAFETQSLASTSDIESIFGPNRAAALWLDYTPSYFDYVFPASRGYCIVYGRIETGGEFGHFGMWHGAIHDPTFLLRPAYIGALAVGGVLLILAGVHRWRPHR